MDIPEKKAELRKRIREMRRMLSPEEREKAALDAADRLLSLEKLVSAGTVLAYMPMKYELDIGPAVERLRARGVNIAYPLCVEEGGLRLLIPSEKDGFAPGAYGILEPRLDNSLEISPEVLDAIILPAIGFDKSCRRLGQGGGYYDRLLARSDCFTVAVGFDCQLVESIPTEQTDMPVDAVVTPSFTILREHNILYKNFIQPID